MRTRCERKEKGWRFATKLMIGLSFFIIMFDYRFCSLIIESKEVFNMTTTTAIATTKTAATTLRTLSNRNFSSNRSSKKKGWGGGSSQR